MTWPGSDTPPDLLDALGSPGYRGWYLCYLNSGTLTNKYLHLLEGYNMGGRETPPTLTELSLAVIKTQHNITPC